MQKEGDLLTRKVKDSKLAALRPSNFSPLLTQKFQKHSRYLQIQRVEQRRTMVHTSFCHSRSLNSSPHSRSSKTSQASRLSQYVQREVSRLREDCLDLEFDPIVRSKIKELRELMHQKEVALRNPKNRMPQKYFFSEYKLKDVQDRQEHSITLHSRKKVESPFMRTLRPRRIMISPQLKSIEEPIEREEKERIVMVGGGLSFTKAVSDEPYLQLESPQSKLSERQTSRSSHRYYLRSGLTQIRQKPAEAIPENDCRPWEIHKVQHLQEYGI